MKTPLTQLNTVGPALSEKLIQSGFTSIAAIAHSTSKELSVVEGIGAVRSKNIIAHAKKLSPPLSTDKKEKSRVVETKSTSIPKATTEKKISSEIIVSNTHHTNMETPIENSSDKEEITPKKEKKDKIKNKKELSKGKKKEKTKKKQKDSKKKAKAFEKQIEKTKNKILKKSKKKKKLKKK